MIYLYQDEGVCSLAKPSIYAALSKLCYLDVITANDIINDKLRLDGAEWLIMPGGADILYCKKLNGIGNRKIIEFVQFGGNYLGICAGAYYAGSFIEFHKNHPTLEVKGQRELCFYPGKIIGPILSDYSYNSHEGARLAIIKNIVKNKLNDRKICNMYFNGGGYFVNSHLYANVRVLYEYLNQKSHGLPAIVECRIGNGNKGGKAILSGVHLEYNKSILEKELLKKSNGWGKLSNIFHKISYSSNLEILQNIILHSEEF